MTISDYSKMFGMYGSGSPFGSSGDSGFFSNATLYRGFSEVNSIGYKHLMKKYFNDADPKAEHTSSTGRPLSDKLEELKKQEQEAADAKAAKGLKADAADLSKAAGNLTAVDKDNNNILFSKDDETIRKAVRSFVDEYNGMLETISKSDYSNTRMQSLQNQMTSLSKANSFKLEKAGISVDRSGSLVVNEKAFEAADTSVLKEIFTGKNSFADRAGDKAEYVSKNAAHYTNDSYGTYTRKKDYNSILGTGNLYNNFF